MAGSCSPAFRITPGPHKGGLRTMWFVRYSDFRVTDDQLEHKRLETVVKYSSRFPRRTICWRIASSIAPRIAPVQQGLQRCDRAIDFRSGFAASRLHIRLHNRVADWPKGAIWGGSGWGIK